MPIYTFRSKMNQEKSLARLAELKAKKEGSGVYAVLVSEKLKGYVFIEGESQYQIEETVSDIKIISSRAIGNREVPIEELDDLIDPTPTIKHLDQGDIVEIVDGPFNGLKAKIVRIEEQSMEITAELIDSTMALPVKLHSDYVKKVAS